MDVFAEIPQRSTNKESCKYDDARSELSFDRSTASESNESCTLNEEAYTDGSSEMNGSTRSLNDSTGAPNGSTPSPNGSTRSTNGVAGALKRPITDSGEEAGQTNGAAKRRRESEPTKGESIGAETNVSKTDVLEDQKSKSEPVDDKATEYEEAMDVHIEGGEQREDKQLTDEQANDSIESERMDDGDLDEEMDDGGVDNSRGDEKEADNAAADVMDGKFKAIEVIQETGTGESKPKWFARRRAESRSDECAETFEELNLSPQLLQNIRSSYMERPSDLQKRVLPLLLKSQGANVYIKSRPHSGKKTAFLINALHRINPDLPETQAIIIAPTAELVYYIAEAAKDLAQHMNVRVFQATKDDQLSQKIHHHLIVTTLGTFLYLKRKRVMELSWLCCLVFDELDLLMATEKNIGNMMTILNKLKYISYQLSFFSNSFCEHSLAVLERFGVPNLLVRNILSESFAHEFLQFQNYSRNDAIKEDKLFTVLRNTIKSKIVIYSLGTKKAKHLAALLQLWQFTTVLITADTTLVDRLAAVHRFNSSNQQTILCTTYPVCHGISFDDVNVVINYNLPMNLNYLPIEYMHCISKCNTANQTPAFIVNLVDPESRVQLKRLEDYYKIQMIELKISRDD